MKILAWYSMIIVTLTILFDMARDVAPKDRVIAFLLEAPVLGFVLIYLMNK